MKTAMEEIIEIDEEGVVHPAGKIAKPRRKKSPAVSGQFYAAVEEMIGEVPKAGEKAIVRFVPVSCPLQNSAQVKAWIKAKGKAGETYLILVLSRRVSLTERTLRKISEV